MQRAVQHSCGAVHPCIPPRPARAASTKESEMRTGKCPSPHLFFLRIDSPCVPESANCSELDPLESLALQVLDFLQLLGYPRSLNPKLGKAQPGMAEPRIRLLTV